MSPPQHFNIVVIAENHKGRADLAVAVAGILRTLGMSDMRLTIWHHPPIS